MKEIKLLLTISATVLFFMGCSTNPNLEVSYLKDGKLGSEKIPVDFIKDGRISSPYIDTLKFSVLDSLTYPENNPDRDKIYSTPVDLDFSKKIEPYSPEYYSVYTVYNILKDIEYYNKLFDNKIDFNSQTEFKTIEIMFGDVPLLTHPNFYIIEKKSNPSPALFYHEIGHRVFWYLEGVLGIKFGGLTVTHMGLLEYFTVLFNNSPIVGEGFFSAKLFRDAGLTYKYPMDSTFRLRQTFKLVEESYPEKLKNPESNISKYLATCYAYYTSYVLDSISDNHRGRMVLTSTLWRIRQQIGQEKADRLVAQTILNLNDFLGKRSEFYQSNDLKSNRIDWCDVFYGLIQKDKELFIGKNIEVIKKEFAQTGYPVDLIIMNINKN